MTIETICRPQREEYAIGGRTIQAPKDGSVNLEGPRHQRGCRCAFLSLCVSGQLRSKVQSIDKAAGAMLQYKNGHTRRHRCGGYFPADGSGARSRGVRGLPIPVVPEGASPPAVVLPTRSNVVTNAANAATITAIANNRITGSGFRSVLMSNSTQAGRQLSSAPNKPRIAAYQLSVESFGPSALQIITCAYKRRSLLQIQNICWSNRGVGSDGLAPRTSGCSREASCHVG
ncbi:hypothetical protein ACVWWI_006748 [Bradyrhizobium sp. USDA 3686]|nr:hypothetical protein [Bradyrhizobium canariense]